MEGPSLPRQGATTTRAAAGATVQPHCDQVINITRAPGVTNTHPARIRHRIMSLGVLYDWISTIFSSGQPGPGEGDVIMSI